MIMQKTFLNKIRDFGLNSYESKLWTALLSRGISTAGELSDIAHVPRSRTYDVLESLEKKGFIIMKIGKPIKYIAVPPAEVVERVKKNIQKEAEKNTKVLDDMKDSEVLKELNMLHTQGVDLIEPTDISGCLKGRKSFYNHMEYLVNSSKSSLVLVSTTDGLKGKHKALKKSLEKARKRGVEIRIATTEDSQSEVLNLMKEFGEVRKSNRLQGRFLVADKKDIAFALLDGNNVHPTYDVGIWVNTPFFAEAFQTMFDHVWKDMKPLN